MSQLDTYRNTMLRKQEDIVKLNQDLAKEQAKIADSQKKIISAQSAIGRTKNQSTIKLRLNDIERANKLRFYSSYSEKSENRQQGYYSRPL